jgi:hypothetical protein
MKRFRFEEIPEITGPGIYKFFLVDGATLPGVSVDKTGLLYVGTTKTENDRDHFKPNSSNSTFRRTIGAILKDAGILQLEAYLRGLGNDPRKDGTHFKFTSDGESRLTEWMKVKLEFSYEILKVSDKDREDRETEQITRLGPPLNLNKWKNPRRPSLMALRRICSTEAKQNGRLIQDNR